MSWLQLWLFECFTNEVFVLCTFVSCGRIFMSYGGIGGYECGGLVPFMVFCSSFELYSCREKILVGSLNQKLFRFKLKKNVSKGKGVRALRVVNIEDLIQKLQSMVN